MSVARTAAQRFARRINTVDLVVARALVEGATDIEAWDMVSTVLPGVSDVVVTDRVRSVYAANKTGLYWAKRDRQYRARKDEAASGRFTCPRSGCGGTQMGKSLYKMRDGARHHLLVCPSCLCVIRTEDIIGHQDYLDRPVFVPKVEAA